MSDHLTQENSDETLLHQIVELLQRRPELLNRVINSAIHGVGRKVKEAVEYGIDMEVLASGAMSLAMEKGRVTKKAKEQFEKLALAKLEKHANNTRCEWNWATKKKGETL